MELPGPAANLDIGNHSRVHTIVYIYRVASDRVDEFLRIQRAAAAI